MASSGFTLLFERDEEAALKDVHTVVVTSASGILAIPHECFENIRICLIRISAVSAKRDNRTVGHAVE